MSRSLATRAARIAIAVVLALLAALAATWAQDRSHGWQTPHWPPPGAVSVRGDVGLARVPPRRTLEAIAINPACSHCLELLATLADSLARHPREAPLVALIVDVPRRPTPLDLAPVRAAHAVWDSSGVWRDRWGRRRYGERMRFDARGRWLGASDSISATSTFAPGARRPEVSPRSGTVPKEVKT